jgi:tetratricopeptide (TPR) repeat protein
MRALRRICCLAVSGYRLRSACTAKTVCLLLACVLSHCVYGQGAAAAPAPGASDEAAFEKAMAAMNNGDDATAEPLLRALHRRHPRNFEVNESLGLLYASRDDLAAALPLLEAAALEQPDSAIAHANLGTAYLKLNRSGPAARELARAAKGNPADAATQDALGQAWMLEKQPCLAAEAFGAASAGNAPDFDLLYNNALAHYDCGQPKEAVALLDGATGVNDSASAQSLLGDAEEAQAQYKDAAEHYLRAVQIAPTEPNMYVLGVELLRHWSFDPAIREFAAGVKAFPDSRRMLAGEGIADYGAGHYSEAIHVFGGLLEVDGANAMYGEIFGRSCTVLTTSVDALCARLVPLAEAHPANAKLALYAATQIEHQPTNAQQKALARKLLESALKAEPRMPEAHYEMGMLMQTDGDWQPSIAEMQAAIQLRPDYASAHYRLGLAYSHTGNKPEAQKEMALDRSEAEQKQNDLNARMLQITTLLVQMR